MKTFFLILISILLLLHFSCNKEEKPTQVKVMDSVEVITDTIPLYIKGLIEGKQPQHYLINDTNEYNNLKQYLHPLVKNNPLPYVDFEHKTLIGFRIAKGDWYTTRITKTVYRYNYLKKYLYHILTEYNYRNDSIIGSGSQVYHNFLLIPKIPTDFTVEFDSTYIYYSPW